MNHGSLFSGIGGFDLAAQWMGWNNVFHCEWNEFGKRVLKYYWPKAISYDDITKTDFTIHRGQIDILSGGFPCQGFSVAGLRKGTEDYRFLWPEMRRAYQESKPTWIIAENVTGLITMEDKREVSKDVFFKVEGRRITRLREIDLYEAIYIRQTKMLIESICQELEKDGYEAQPIVVPAASVEAPHRRERVWIIAHRHSNGFQRDKKFEKGFEHLGRGETFSKPNSPNGFGLITDSHTPRLPVRIRSGVSGYYGERETFTGSQHSRTFTEIPNWRQFPTQSPVCGRDDGLPTELDGITFSKWRQESIKAYGNAIVPQVAYEIFKAIEMIENEIFQTK